MKIKINIKSREFECSLGLGFLGELIDVLDISYDELFIKYEKNPFKYIPVMMYECIKYTLDRDGNEIDFTLADLCDWIDEDGGLKNEALITFSNKFIESISKDVPKEEIKKEGTKKK